MHNFLIVYFFLIVAEPTPHDDELGVQVYSNDIGTVIGKTNLAKAQRYHLLKSPWIPPTNYKYPTTKQGSRLRKFQSQWLKDHPWLTYSKDNNGAYCRYCVLFPIKVDGVSDFGQLVSEPLHEFAKGKAYIEKHETRKYHLYAKERATSFQLTYEKKKAPVNEVANAAVEIQNERVSNGLVSVVKSVIYLSQQGLALRGHRNEGIENISLDRYSGETVQGSNSNPGNLMALLELTSSYDSCLMEHLRNSPRNRLYISKDPQNTIVCAAAKQITDVIVQEVKEARYFSIMGDECGDSANIEQLALTVRYVRNGQITEKFLCLVECDEGTSGEAIANLVTNTLEAYDLNLDNIIAFTTDGASNMAGRVKGAVARLKNKHPNIQHIHCLAHVLNLSIMGACNNSFIQSMFATVQAVYSFFSQSPKRTSLLNLIVDECGNMGPNAKRKIRDICRTRWVERYNALESMLTLLPHVVECMQRIIEEDDWNQDSRSKATILLDSVTSYKFIVSLVMGSTILLATKSLCQKLQGRAYDICLATDAIADSIKTLQQIRDGALTSGSDAVNWWEMIDDRKTKFNVTAVMPRVVGNQRHRSSTPAATPEEYYIRNLALPFIDELVSDMTERYNNKNVLLLRLFALVPSTMVQTSAGGTGRLSLSSSQITTTLYIALGNLKK